MAIPSKDIDIATNIVRKFENPKLPNENNTSPLDNQTSDGVRFQAQDVIEVTEPNMPDQLRDELDAELNRMLFKARQAYQDRYLSVKNFLDLLRKQL